MAHIFFPFIYSDILQIEIDITTGGHQLKRRFLFAIVYKNGLFQILGYSSYQKKLGMSDAYQKFCRGCPTYCAAHNFRPFTKVLFSIVIWIRRLWKWYFRHSWKYCFNSIYNTAIINYPLYLWINSFFINVEQSRGYKTHGIRTD